jgi:hypothetical protein
MKVPQDAWGPQDSAGYRYAVARIRCLHPGNPQWANPVVLTIRDKGGAYEIVGIDRPRTDAAVQYDHKKHPARDEARPQP